MDADTDARMLSSQANDRSMLLDIYDAVTRLDPARGAFQAINQRRYDLDADANRTCASGCNTSARTH
jgi:hypothetical protein